MLVECAWLLGTIRFKFWAGCPAEILSILETQRMRLDAHHTYSSMHSRLQSMACVPLHMLVPTASRSYLCSRVHDIQMLRMKWLQVPEGVDWATVNANAMSKYSVEIAGGLGGTVGKAWRVGIMGYNATPANVELVLAAFRDGLRQQGRL